ncbi:n-dimethylarginine dimethylaminohydrolase [Stylonychia lemnae]|uniref:N-dimethylarginine dimethylaminohydrolase n=1 Tax=Stylonychia lemnae TaxID=5949 RepID=A0A078B8A3_STYLE|nr:n-dimethylarginine dimethylaminohydrolase [Stylonychia lemnae]|eukprot:CDW90634.1 n-dimethylarginine dimethylaminohydrolase [Stylonychia lemnae]
MERINQEFLFTSAVIRRPCKQLINGLTTQDIDKPDFDVAILQHSDYAKTLIESGIKNLIELDAREDYPDSVFVEDTAVALPNYLLITQLGAISRRGEFTEDIREAFGKFYSQENIIEMTGNEYLDGGDVMRAGNTYFIGLSTRTNQEGADKLIKILQEKEGLNGIALNLPEGLHLKTIVTYLDENLLVGIKTIENIPEFDKYEKIIVEEDERHGANILNINGNIVVPGSCPKLHKVLQDRGYTIKPVICDEFRKIDGSLTCMSVLIQ